MSHLLLIQAQSAQGLPLGEKSVHVAPEQEEESCVSQ